MRKPSFLLAAPAALLSALTLAGLLSSCEQRADELPQPTAANSAQARALRRPYDVLQPLGCGISATVRSYFTPDSCRGFVLELADSSRTRLRPTGPLWRSFRPRAGQRVRFGYTYSTDSISGCRGPIYLVGRPVRITCIRPDSIRQDSLHFNKIRLGRATLR